MAYDPSRSLDSHQVLIFLLAFRLLNASTLRTFFQPDEYYQALEPAWNFTPGYNSAWVTWEWEHHLRSASHPAIFSLAYRMINFASCLFDNKSLQESLTQYSPKTVQAIIAALGDYFTWRLALKVYTDSRLAQTALYLTVLNPWQWFCSTRTFSNGLESTLTAAALYYWPLAPRKLIDGGKGNKQLVIDSAVGTDFRLSLILAAVATVLRPTNLLLWIILTGFFVFSTSQLTPEEISEEKDLLNGDTHAFFVRLQLLAKEATLCGSSVLTLSALIDRAFYGVWTLPILNFFQFNIVQSLAVFYGNNDWHYYISQGHPLMLTTVLPFAIHGLYRVIKSTPTFQRYSSTTRGSLTQLATICLVLPAALSVLSHKEVRFIYPILAPLHVISAAPVLDFFKPAIGTKIQKLNSNLSSRFSRRLLLLTVLSINLIIAGYTSLVHNSGLIAFPEYIRHEFQTHYSPRTTPGATTQNLTLGILMPCHSVPWRSHFLNPPTASNPGIQAWALTCEPPLHLTSATAKTTYQDEADIFYANPSRWIKENMSRRPPWAYSGLQAHERHHEPGLYTDDQSTRNKKLWSRDRDRVGPLEPHGLDITDLLPYLRTAPGRPPRIDSEIVRRPWPHYLAFFEQLEPTMKTVLRGSGYLECWRVFNSHWHDDWRRQGDVVVWCLFPERASKDSRVEMVGEVVVGVREDDCSERVVPERAGKQRVIKPQGQDA